MLTVSRLNQDRHKIAIPITSGKTMVEIVCEWQRRVLTINESALTVIGMDESEVLVTLKFDAGSVRFDGFSIVSGDKALWFYFSESPNEVGGITLYRRCEFPPVVDHV